MKYFFPVFLLTMLWGAQHLFARELPLQQISDPACKAQHRSSHSQECKRDFTIPNDETVFKSPGMTTDKLLFSVLYKGSYKNWHSDLWGHPGVDIVSAKGTPLYAIWEGEVIKAQMMNWFWNAVVIKHYLENGEIIYSNYSHMEKIIVTEWELVIAWQNIWTIWNSWFTMWPLWNHIDFQITTQESPSHPYGYYWCSAGYMSAVQNGLCTDELEKATLDPLALLRSNIWTISVPRKDTSVSTKNTTKPLITSENIQNNKGISSSEDQSWWKNVSTKWSTLPNVATINMDEIEVVLDNSTSTLKLAESLPRIVAVSETTPSVIWKTHPSNWEKSKSKSQTQWPTQIWNYLIQSTMDTLDVRAWAFAKLTISVTDLEWNPINWMLDAPISLKTTGNISTFVDGFQFIIWGKKQVVVSAWENWNGEIEIQRNKQTTKKILIDVK